MNNSDLLKAAAEEAQAEFVRRYVTPTITLPLVVRLADIDLQGCGVAAFYEPDIGGWQYEVDLTGATAGGYPIDEDALTEDVREDLVQRAIAEFNEGPEAA